MGLRLALGLIYIILHEAGNHVWTVSPLVILFEPDFLKHGCSVGPDPEALGWEGLSFVVSDGGVAVGAGP